MTISAGAGAPVCQKMHSPVNIYAESRITAGFKSRDEAIMVLPIGWRTLARIESNKRDAIPDEVLDMAKAYCDENLPVRHCREMCPIGRKYGNKVGNKEITVSVLGLLREINHVCKHKDRLIEIASDGIIDDDEMPDWNRIMYELAELGQVIDEIKWYARSKIIQKPAPAMMVAEERAVYGQKNKVAWQATL